jgi:hypothetical protein
MQFGIYFQNICTLKLYLKIFSKTKAKLIKTCRHDIIYDWHAQNVFQPIWHAIWGKKIFQELIDEILDLFEHLQP